MLNNYNSIIVIHFLIIQNLIIIIIIIIFHLKFNLFSIIFHYI